MVKVHLVKVHIKVYIEHESTEVSTCSGGSPRVSEQVFVVSESTLFDHVPAEREIRNAKIY